MSTEPLTSRVQLPTARTFLPRAYQELTGMAGVIMNSGLDDRALRRADIAAFTAFQVEDRTYINAAPAISS